MKQRFLLVILALLAIFACSCEQKQPDRPMNPSKPLPEKITGSEPEYGEMETGNIGGDYIYASTNSRLIKYHIPSGTATWVCQDPFCEHSLNCQFKVPDFRYAAIGNILYYVTEIDGQCRLRSYDGDSMKIEEIRISNGVLSRLFSYNYYLYFSELNVVDGNIIDAVIYRWDTQNGKTDVIDCGDPYAKIYKIEAGRIVWEKGDKYFSTDLSGEDEREYTPILQREWGQYVYRWTLDSNGKYTGLYRKDRSTNQEIMIAQDFDWFYFYGDKVVYWKRTDTPRYVTSDAGKQIKDEWGGNVYIMNSDGSNAHLLCHVEDFYYGNMPSIACGDWVGIISMNYYPHENTWGGAALALTDMLIVNVVTDEYKLIKFNPYE